MSNIYNSIKSLLFKVKKDLIVTVLFVAGIGKIVMLSSKANCKGMTLPSLDTLVTLVLSMIFNSSLIFLKLVHLVLSLMGF